MTGTILGAALGTCVHVGGLHHFLKLAESEGYFTHSLGPAVAIDRLVGAIRQTRPTIVAVSYRLTPEVAERLFGDLKAALQAAGLEAVRLVFGGTPPVARAAEQSGLFEQAFSGQEPLEAVRAYLRVSAQGTREQAFPQDLVSRIKQKYPYPLLRHHFGRPSLGETIEGARVISEAGVLEVLSLGTDQNAQEHFFHPDEMDPTMDGAGGVPVRSSDHLKAIYQSTRCGNFPLVRCYSGTRELIRWAEMSVSTIHNAWAAIPLCWYSVMDGRSQVPLVAAITEKELAMRWYAQRGIPVEVNESHQWSLRDAHDSLAVAMAFLAAYNAKAVGVRNYVAQYMFNTPPGTTPAMDIAKMTAKRALIETLHDATFVSYREVRAGIAHFSSNPSIAQGQLAASAVVSLALEPHILHVVGSSEGDHAAAPDEVIQSCDIVHGVLQDCLGGLPNLVVDEHVQRRKHHLIQEAKLLLEAVRRYGSAVCTDPWSDPYVLASAIKVGLFDAPHFRGNRHLCGTITTRLVDGAWHAIDPATGDPIGEEQRTERILRAQPPLDPPPK
jgi:methylmalonyl-CoA mutase cobalamin-binding subunit